MPEEVNPSVAQEPEPVTENEAPVDFRAYVKYRETGELPAKKEPEPATPAAAGTGADAPEAPAKTEPDSEPEKTQEPDEQDDEDQTAAKGRGGSRQRKIERLTRENADLQRQLAAFREPPPAEKPERKPATSAAAGKPKLEDFETLEAYQEALTDWKLDEREHVRTVEHLKRQANEAQQKIQAEWSKRQRIAQQAHADYSDVIESVDAPEGPGVADAIAALQEDEAGPEILYYLAKHPDDLKRIAALSARSAVLEIGKIAAIVAKPPAPENGKPKITGAPKPPPPSGKSTKTSSDDINDPVVVNDYARWERLRRAQLERK